jgi:uncharacterized repeat protein (TIGR01451 family)
MSLAPGSSLPAGLSFDTYGEIQGTPTTPGTTTFTVLAASGDASALSSSKDFTLTVSPRSLAFTTTGLPTAVSGVPYTTTLSATGGTGSYTFAPAPGTTLPAGLVLDATGLLHGTPSGSGLQSVSVQVTDSSIPAMTATASLPLTVLPPFPPSGPDLAVTLNNLQKFVPGQNGTYRMHVLNVGSMPSARSAKLTLTLPVGLAYAGVTASGWSCQHTVRSVTCTHASALPPGADSVLSVLVHVLAPVGTRLITRVGVTPLDAAPGNNTATNTVQTARR